MTSESEPKAYPSIGREEAMYQQWCWEHRLDPDDTQSMIDYEGGAAYPWDDDEEER